MTTIDYDFDAAFNEIFGKAENKTRTEINQAENTPIVPSNNSTGETKNKKPKVSLDTNELQNRAEQGDADEFHWFFHFDDLDLTN